jgi:hypothetical protein
MKETWKAIPGYEGFYSVSDYGRVRSETRTIRVVSTWSAVPYQYIRKGTICKIAKTKPGKDAYKKYQIVSLSKDGVSTVWMVHILVLIAFVGPRPVGMEGCHYPDPDVNNQHVSNLIWGTHAENMSHRKGFKHSDETKKKIAMANSNPSFASRLKMSVSARLRTDRVKGRVCSEETKKKIRGIHLGMKASLITRRKMSISRKLWALKKNPLLYQK